MIYPVITIRQPWAALIVNGYKNVENRNWRLPDKYINTTVLIHSSTRPEFLLDKANAELNKRGFNGCMSCHGYTALTRHIIGAVKFKYCECSEHYSSPISNWCDTTSKFWWVVEKTIPIFPMAAKGKLSFWQFDYPHEIVWP